MSQRALPSILVVEDDLDLRQTIVASLEANGFSAAQVSDAAEAIERLRSSAYDGLVVDLRLPDADGVTVLDEALERYPQIRAVVMTGFGGVAEAVGAIKRGAVDFLIKPFQLSQLARVLQAGLEQQRLRQENAELKAQLKGKFRFENIIGRHSTMQALFTTLELVAPLQSTVLIHGETGTGKELIARTIHHNSPRANERFVAFNAAAIPDTLAEVELFGHSKGAFTGSATSRAGRFEMAHRGTLFIDEVASMSLPLQAKVLHALQQREIERVGESRPMRLDIRVIAATNMDLRKMVKEGTFREDLFYRLNVIPLTVPALRQRRDDIPLLAQHFVRKSCNDNGIAVKTLSPDAIRTLMAYDWPGNIRQFENAIEHAVAMTAAKPEIGPEALPDDVRERTASMLVPAVAIPDEGLNFTSLVAQLERELILRCLEKTGGNKRQAARLLNLSRTTFIDKLHRLNLERGAA
jgi:two-component system, NtrC family, response regulator AtoC